MIKIIFFSYPGYSHEVPAFELLNYLSENEEIQIYYFANKSNYLEKLSKNIRVIYYEISFKSNLSSYVKYNKKITITDIIINFHMLCLYILEKKEDLVDFLTDHVKTIKPDIIMYDSFAHWGYIIAKKFNIPSVSSIAIYPYDINVLNMDDNYFMNTYLADNKKILQKNINKQNRRILDILKIKISNRLYFTNNSPYSAFINYGDLNISYSSKKFYTNKNKFINKFIFVGRSIKINPENINLYKNKLNKSKPTIYICLGTVFNNNIDFYKKCINAFKKTNFQVIISIGKSIQKEDLGKIPGNFIIKNFLPQLEILKLSDVFITQGGFNAVNESLSLGVPLLVIPQALDQYTIASCIKKLQAGIYLKKKNFSPGKLKQLTIKLLKSKKYKKNCEKISKSLTVSKKYDKAKYQMLSLIDKNF